MRRWCLALLLVAACHRSQGEGGGRTAHQERTARETSEAAKKGALKQHEDPKADLARQKKNLARLERNAKENRAYGNRIAAWTAEHDARRVKKIIAKREKELGQ